MSQANAATQPPHSLTLTINIAGEPKVQEVFDEFHTFKDVLTFLKDNGHIKKDDDYHLLVGGIVANPSFTLHFYMKQLADADYTIYAAHRFDAKCNADHASYATTSREIYNMIKELMKIADDRARIERQQQEAFRHHQNRLWRRIQKFFPEDE